MTSYSTRTYVLLELLLSLFVLGTFCLVHFITQKNLLLLMVVVIASKVTKMALVGSPNVLI